MIAKDRWFSIDKLYHFIVCMALTVVFGWLVSIMAAVAKEIYDINKSGFSYKDLTADVIGVGVGMIIRMIIGI